MSEDKELTIGRIATNIPTPIVYPKLFKAEPFRDRKSGKEMGEPKYSATFLLQNDDQLKALKVKAIEAAKEEFGSSVDLKTVKFPFKDGNKFAAEKEGKRDWAKGFVLMATTANEKFRPTVTDFHKNFEEIRDANAIYNGALCCFEVKFKGTEVNDNKYVTAYLNQVVLVEAGERIQVGGRSAADTFSGIVGRETDEDPTEGLDDEIPF